MVEGQAERADRPVVVANGVVISCVITIVIWQGLLRRHV